MFPVFPVFFSKGGKDAKKGGKSGQFWWFDMD